MGLHVDIMIKINLLPAEYRKKKTKYIELIQQYKSLAIPVAGFIVGFIVIVLLIILVYPKWQQRTLTRLEIKWSEIKEEYSEVKELREKEEELKNKLNDINYIISKRLLWAPKLNAISDALPGEIQLTEIAIVTEVAKDRSKKKLLTVSGIVPAFPGERAIEEFIISLREDPDITVDFPKVELAFTETIDGGVKKFMLKLYFHEKHQEEKEEELKEGKTKKKKSKK